ncbi:hypothetical protein G6F42_027736 [Rhizopus arrhizus]|nr:hypothetical protein G6F42_027736 [Rhizopus arrhizus]
MKLLSVIAACALVSAGVEAKTFLYPIPQDVAWAGTSTTLSSNFKISGAQNTHVKSAAKRYLSLIKSEKWVPVQVATDKTKVKAVKGQLKGLNIKVKDNKAKLDIDVDESYKLDVPSQGGYATLSANTWVGALRALETFSQLVVADGKKLVAHTATIKDQPSYGHRGILLDTSHERFALACN